MLTALSVVVPNEKNKFQKLLHKLKKDKVEIKIERARGVFLKHIIYTSYSKTLRLELLDEAVAGQKARLLCSKKLEFPANSVFKRFESKAFSARLCTNMALQIIRNCKDAEFKIGIYDSMGKHSDFLVWLLKCCADVVVYTTNSEPYINANQEALDESGASAMITKSLDELYDCNLIIAPDTIKDRIVVNEKCVILTVSKPAESINGQVYYKYHFRMPNGFEKIKPEELDEEYFCSALYTLANQYELGSIVPLTCRNDAISQTVDSLTKELTTAKE